MKNMWKLTIKQSIEGSYITHEIEFLSDDINNLTTMIIMLSCFESKNNTTYKIEKVGEQE